MCIIIKESVEMRFIYRRLQIPQTQNKISAPQAILGALRSSTSYKRAPQLKEKWLIFQGKCFLFSFKPRHSKCGLGFCVLHFRDCPQILYGFYMILYDFDRFYY